MLQIGLFYCCHHLIRSGNHMVTLFEFAHRRSLETMKYFTPFYSFICNVTEAGLNMYMFTISWPIFPLLIPCFFSASLRSLVSWEALPFPSSSLIRNCKRQIKISFLHLICWRTYMAYFCRQMSFLILALESKGFTAISYFLRPGNTGPSGAEQKLCTL